MKIRQTHYVGVGGLKEANKTTYVQTKYNGASYDLHIHNGRAVALTSKRISKKTGLLNDKLDNLPLLKRIKFPFKKETIICCEVSAEHLNIPQGKICGFVSGIMNSSPETLAEKFPQGNPLKLIAFDFLMYEGNHAEDCLYKIRYDLLKQYFPCAGHLGQNVKKNGSMIYSVKNWTNPQLNTIGADLDDDSFPTFDELDEIAQSDKFPFEGFVVKDSRSNLSAKILKEKNADCVILGFTEGKNKYEGQIGAITVGVLSDEGNQIKMNKKYLSSKNDFDKNDLETFDFVEVGNISGFNEELRLKISKNKKKYLGKVVRTKYKNWTGKKMFHGRIDSDEPFRTDKNLCRCNLEQFGE